MKRLITLSLLLWALVSCSYTVQPTSIATVTNEVVTAAIPAETLPIPGSSTPTPAMLDSPVPDPGDVMNPQGSPAQEWRGIPIMPEAVAGQEFVNVYGFRVNASAQEVQAFYEERLTQLGWSQPFDRLLNEDGGTITFRKEQSSLSITITPSEGSVVVLLALALA